MNNARIYFDNAATSYPKPRSVIEAIERCLVTAGGNPGRSSHALAAAAAELIYNTRCSIGELLDVKAPESIVFTLNATYALNLAIKSQIRKGMYVLIGNMEHNAVYRPINALKRDGTIEFDVFNCREDPIASITRVARRTPDMIVLNHVSNVDGHRCDIERLGAYCAQNKILFIIDASQSVGHLPISFSKTGATALCAPGHKGLFGIQGCGFICFSTDKEAKTIIEGGSGSTSLSSEMPRQLPERLEAGTLPTPAVASLQAGVERIKAFGVRAIEEHERALVLRAKDMLDSLGATVYSAKNGGGVLSFNYKNVHPSTIGEGLSREGICVRTGLHCSPLAHRTIGTLPNGTVRLSFSIFNDQNELNFFYKALKNILFLV
ncbi:MAG: aminotransferase class V-fold PLP-dependent enzyme [Clostridia bacterium]|nr:aminotransferase class V-fold PLP-dependent enzyme [Clostridia bacterium]